jgi:hypothetical protein
VMPGKLSLILILMIYLRFQSSTEKTCILIHRLILWASYIDGYQPLYIILFQCYLIFNTTLPFLFLSSNNF